MIPTPTFEITGEVTGHATFMPVEKKKNVNMKDSTFTQTAGERKFYVLKTMGGEFPITLTADLKDAMENGRIYKLSGILEAVRGGISLKVNYIEPSDELGFMTNVPSWQAVGVVRSVQQDQEARTSSCVFGIPGLMIKFYNLPMDKVSMDSDGQLAKVDGVLATRTNQRTGSTSIDTQFGNIEYVSAEDVLKQGREAAQATTKTTKKQTA